LHSKNMMRKISRRIFVGTLGSAAALAGAGWLLTRNDKPKETSEMLTLYTFGDSILDCAHYNDHGVTPGSLLVKNDDKLFPEFRGQDLQSRGTVKLEHRAQDGATVDSLPRQLQGLNPGQGRTVAIITIGGNDLLRGLVTDQGLAIDTFASKLDTFLGQLPVQEIFIGNVYDPSFGDDSLNFLGIDPELARRNHVRVNTAIARAAANHKGKLVDLHAHFLTGDPSWLTRTIEPSLIGASEVRRCFLPYF
jgi:acyl-CoA thioesterase-1